METKQRHPRWRINKDGRGMGGLMCPPGHWNHLYMVERWVGGRTQDYEGWANLDQAVDDTSLPATIRGQARRIRETTELVCSERWLRHTYGYFRNCYAPEDLDRNVSNAIIPKAGEEIPPPERHLAVLCVRAHFPEHEPRLDLIADPGRGYGSWACTKCDQPVQYEARWDKLVVYPTGLECPKGGDHEWPE